MLSRNPFRRPFPERPFGRAVIIGHGRTGLFVFVALLFLFSPLTALAYGLVTFLVAIAYHYLSERLGVKRTGSRWTMTRWTLDQAALLLLVSLACFLFYNATVNWSVLNVRVLLYITVPTVLVGLLPIVISGIALQLRAEGEHQRVAGRIQLAGVGEHSKICPIVFAARLPEGRAMLHYDDGGQEPVREGLQGVTDRHAAEGLVRCHRDYAVNRHCVAGVSADAQGLRLRMSVPAPLIPVSPDYFSAI